MNDISRIITRTKNAFLDGRWSCDDAARVYSLEDWGKGYFGTNDAGHLTVRPEKGAAREIDVHELVQGLRERGIYTPVLMRFTDLTRHRLTEIRAAFDEAIEEHDYGGGYSCVYPIKVNQQRHVCEEIRDIGAELGFGLEAGSKPELLAVLGLTVGHDKMPIVCNGFKDRRFIETVILATKLGRNIIPVVEKFSELEMIVEHAKKYDVKPQIGVRAKLSMRGSGKWEHSSGVRSKFGLHLSEILQAVDFLREHDMLDCLMMIHCHVGSQVNDIRHLKNAISELAHVYTELVRLGAGMTTIDVGGGLGVDYDGSQSAWGGSSVNYTVDEYASDVVYRIKLACDDAKVAHPRIISESGRAMVAYSSVLVVDVLGTSRVDNTPDLQRIKELVRLEEERLGEDEVPQPVFDLLEAYEEIAERNLMEVCHDALQAREEAMSLFSLGYMSLTMRSVIEELFWAVGRKMLDWAGRRGQLPEELGNLPEILSDIYFCNFSLFQSMPDSWAIEQVFPVCPIHRLDEEPTRRGILADITCDSDGKVDFFVDKRGEKKALELHELREGEPYYLGMFLVGAYQEVLGDLHNLLGDTHVVHVSLDEEGHYEIDRVIEGDRVREVLDYVGFDAKQLHEDLRRNVEKAVKKKRITVAESKSLLKFYSKGLAGYTYLFD